MLVVAKKRVKIISSFYSLFQLIHMNLECKSESNLASPLTQESNNTKQFKISFCMDGRSCSVTELVCVFLKNSQMPNFPIKLRSDRERCGLSRNWHTIQELLDYQVKK